MELSEVLVLFATLCLCNAEAGRIKRSSKKSACPDRKPLNYRPTNVIPTGTVKDDRFDSVIVVTESTDHLIGNLAFLKSAVDGYTNVDSSATSSPVLIITDSLPSKRLIWAPTGPLHRDYDDVRRFADAAEAGLGRAVGAGSKKPLLVRPQGGPFEAATMVATLGALDYLYLPLELREAGITPKIEFMGVWCDDMERGVKELNQTLNLETGRIVARDIAGTDPERMAPPQVEAYVREVFRDTDVEMAVISDVETLTRDYPLLAAVNRAANAVPRHRARLIYLEYTGRGNITETLFFVGKGITFDSGGASIKTGSRMIGMSRDKSGAAAVAGFMKVLSLEKPENLRVVGAMPVVRNSIGEESYVVDEVITSRAGVRVRVGNTDAEGRMVMADVLCRMKEMALHAVNPQLIVIATLTGHAVSTVGKSYTIVLDNGPAKEKKTAETIQSAGDIYGDPFEISTIRREDYQSHRAQSQYEDITQIGANSKIRGHQGPAAFMIMVSGLDEHGKNSSHPLAYSHLDIAGSAHMAPKSFPSGVPVVALSGRYILGNGIDQAKNDNSPADLRRV